MIDELEVIERWIPFNGFVTNGPSLCEPKRVYMKKHGDGYLLLYAGTNYIYKDKQVYDSRAKCASDCLSAWILFCDSGNSSFNSWGVCDIVVSSVMLTLHNIWSNMGQRLDPDQTATTKAIEPEKT